MRVTSHVTRRLLFQALFFPPSSLIFIFHPSHSRGATLARVFPRPGGAENGSRGMSGGGVPPPRPLWFLFFSVNWRGGCFRVFPRLFFSFPPIRKIRRRISFFFFRERVYEAFRSGGGGDLVAERTVNVIGKKKEFLHVSGANGWGGGRLGPKNRVIRR